MCVIAEEMSASEKISAKVESEITQSLPIPEHKVMILVAFRNASPDSVACVDGVDCWKEGFLHSTIGS